MPDKARVAELVDAHDSKSSSARSGGSIPSTGTKTNYSIISIAYDHKKYFKSGIELYFASCFYRQNASQAERRMGTIVGTFFAARIFRHIPGTRSSACGFLFRGFRSDAGVTTEHRTCRNQRELPEVQQRPVTDIASRFSSDRSRYPDVRFAAESGHGADALQCPRCARSRHLRPISQERRAAIAVPSWVPLARLRHSAPGSTATRERPPIKRGSSIGTRWRYRS